MSFRRLCLWISLQLASVLLIVIACQQPPNVPAIPEDYGDWHMTTETVLNYAVPGHEDHFRKIYINPIGAQLTRTVRNDRTHAEFPEGTIIVKEIYSGPAEPGPHAKPVMLTVMIKAPTHPQARNGWLWLAQNYATKETNVITYELCVDCHANANERHPYGDGNPDQEFRDYVYFLPAHSASPPPR